MEPPPLTVSKRRDPLRDGLVFQQGAGPGSFQLQLLRPSPTSTAADGGHPVTSLLRSAAEAAAINRSAEARRIKRDWDAMVAASSLPMAFRHGFSPAPTQPRLGSLQGSFRSPTLSSPFLRDPHHLPLPAQRGLETAGRLQYTAGPPSHADFLQAPSTIYRHAMQQQQQQPFHHHHHQQQFQHHQQPPPQQQQGAAGVEVETSKFTRVLHSQNPSYQAMLSSTVEVVRQSAAAQHPVLPQRQGATPLGLPHPHGSRFRVVELPPSPETCVGEQGTQQGQQMQQQQMPAPPAMQQAAVIVDVPSLPSPGMPPPGSQPNSLPANADVQASLPAVQLPPPISAVPPFAFNSQAGTAVHEHGPGAGHVPPASPSVPAVEQPNQPAQQPGPASRPAAQELLAGPSLALSPAQMPSAAQGPTEVVPQVKLQELPGGQDSMGCKPASMEQALAQVGAMVRDLASPDPDVCAEPSSARQEGLPLLQQGQQALMGQAAASRLVGPLSAAEGSVNGVLEKARWWEEPPPSTRRRIRGAQPLAQRNAGPAVLEAAAAACAGGTAGGTAEGQPMASPACSAQAQPSSRAKSEGGSKGAKKHVKAEPVEGATTRRTMLLQGDTATMEPIHRSLGDNVADVQVSRRSGRPHLKPLPFWTNTRVVMNSHRDIVAIERKPDLLGVSEQPTKPKATGRGTQAVKADVGKGNPATEGAAAAKPRQAEKLTEKRRHGRPPAAAAALPVGLVSGQAQAQPKSGRTKVPGTGKLPKTPAVVAVKSEQRTQRQQRDAAKGGVQPEQDSVAEVEAALQLQQLCRGAPASLAAAQAWEANAATASPTVAQAGVVGVAVSAGALAAGKAAKKMGPASTASQAGAVGAAAAVYVGGEEGPSQPGPALPTVEGVAPHIMLRMADHFPAQRRRCGHCKHCRTPACRQACLALQALRHFQAQAGIGARPLQQQHADGQEAEQWHGGTAPTAEHHQQQQRQRGSSKQQPSQQKLQLSSGGGHTVSQVQGRKLGQLQPSKSAKRQQQQAPHSLAKAASKAAGQKRAGEATVEGARARAPKRRKSQLPQRLQQQQAEERDGDQPAAAASAIAGCKKEAVAEAAQQEAEPAAERRRGHEELQEEEEVGEGWTASQVAALQRTWLQINPTANNFWQLVAEQVPGKTATECYNQHMARHPTPPHPNRKPAPTKYLAAAKEGARMPDLKPGASKQVLQNAARKYGRQLQWQQKASRAQALSGGEGIGEGLAEEMEAAERKDRYIDQILRKRQGRPLGAAPRAKKAAAQQPQQQQRPGASLGAAPGQIGGGHKLHAANTEREMRAALAELAEPDSQEERESQEDSDYYWSDA